MMKMLAAGGVTPLTDELRAADGDNPKGYYEFERVKQLDKGDIGWLPMARGKIQPVWCHIVTQRRQVRPQSQPTSPNRPLLLVAPGPHCAGQQPMR